MTRKTLASILLVIAIGLLGYWAVSGAEMFTLTQVQETMVDPNDPFQSETTVWKDEFRPGLLDMIGPASGVLLALSAFLFWSAARRRRNESARTGTSGAHTT
jgi:hypothetical protein